MIKKFLKKIIPNSLISFYHLTLAHLANILYGRPSEKLILIGVTGTNGKSTTVNLIGKILEEDGHRVVVSSTVNFQDGKNEWLNNLKMTMPGRFFLQKLLADGVKNGCKFAVVESSSEGVLQHRQVGLHFDCMVFTNLTPEHIEAHGGWDNYKKAKLEYFQQLQSSSRKKINNEFVPHTIVANRDDKEVTDFTNFNVDKVITFGKNLQSDVIATNISSNENGVGFKVKNTTLNLNLKGVFDVHNALAAVAVASAFQISLDTCKSALEKVSKVPGRMELIEAGQKFKILIDYAPEPEGLTQMYASIQNWKKNKIIHILGSTGGGRDTGRRKILGEIAGNNSDYVIVTNEDPYNDDPKKIIDDVAAGSGGVGKILDKNLFKILDRREAINFALKLAKENDLVIITGKGAEQKMAVKGGYIPWDDRQVVREEIKN